MSSEHNLFSDVDRLIHEPARAIILSVLREVESADFIYLQHETRLTRGNLSVHLSKLEAAGFVHIDKTYRGKVPLTLCQMTSAGRQAFDEYRQQLRNFVENRQE